MSIRAFIGADVFDGTTLHKDKALVLDGETVLSFSARADIPASCEQVRLEGGTILPGFVDLQVNGGGGVMLNDAPSADTLRTMSQAHWSQGTRAFLPTLITDTPQKTRGAVQAVEDAIAVHVPGIIGIHLEGPHLSVARKGAHDAQFIRPMSPADEAFLIEAADRLPNVMVTVAPEAVTPAQIENLAQAGIIVSLGHSDCTCAAAQEAFAAGASCATHLYNAMSQQTTRAPGLVGAVLASDDVSAGLIADGIHVDPVNIRTSLRAKKAPGEIFLVTDAMSPVGSDITEFQLNGRRVSRANGRLCLDDGTLAGADLVLAQAISVLINDVGILPEQAFRMATSAPAKVLKSPNTYGRLVTASPANAIWIDNAFRVTRGI